MTNSGWAGKETVPEYLMATHGRMLWGATPEDDVDFGLDWLVGSTIQVPSQFLFVSTNMMATILGNIAANPYSSNFSAQIAIQHPSASIMASHSTFSLSGVRNALGLLGTSVGIYETTDGEAAVNAYRTQFGDYFALSALDNAITSFKQISAIVAGSPVTLARMSQLGNMVASHDNLYLKQAYSAVQSAITAITSKMSSIPTAVWSASQVVAKGVADSYIGPNSLSSYVSAFLATQEAIAYPSFSNRVARMSAAMGDYGAINGSAFAVGLAALEDSYAKETAQTGGSLILKAYEACIAYIQGATQQIAEIEKSYLMGNISVVQAQESLTESRIQGHIGLVAKAFEMDTLASSDAKVLASMEASQGTLKAQWALNATEVAARERATLFQGYGVALQAWLEYEKMFVSAISTYEVQMAQAKERRRTFDIEQFMSGASFLGALQGSPMIGRPIPLAQQIFGAVSNLAALGLNAYAATSGFGTWNQEG